MYVCMFSFTFVAVVMQLEVQLLKEDTFESNILITHAIPRFGREGQVELREEYAGTTFRLSLHELNWLD